MSSQSNTTCLVVGISGSLRDGSYTRMAVNTALAGAAEVGADTTFLDLRDYALPICGSGDDEAHEGVMRLREAVRPARGIILGTPEYHGGYSGVLKNALDLMGFDEFEGKMLGLIGVSGGNMGATNALSGLRVIGRTLHAWVVPEQVSVPEAFRAFDESGKVLDEKLSDRLKAVGRQVARFAFLHSSEEANEFLRAWEAGPPNPGGE